RHDDDDRGVDLLFSRRPGDLVLELVLGVDEEVGRPRVVEEAEGEIAGKDEDRRVDEIARIEGEADSRDAHIIPARKGSVELSQSEDRTDEHDHREEGPGPLALTFLVDTRHTEVLSS